MTAADSIHTKITNNNFDIVRLVLAIIVVFSHIRDLNKISSDFLSAFSGDFAVQCFFVISGYLIVRSFKKNHDLGKYFLSRAMRILPMYYCSIFSFFIILYFVSNLSFSEYLTNGGVRYLIFNSIFLNFIQPSLPGVFEHNPDISAVNGALWTIKVEVMFYIFVPLWVIVVKKFNKYWSGLFLLAIVLSILFKFTAANFSKSLGIPEQFENQLPAVLSFFLLGGMVNYLDFARFSRKLIFIFWGGAAVYLIFSGNLSQSVDIFIRPIAVACFILPLCLQRLVLIPISPKIGDLSYGIYVIHFPLIQLLISLGMYNKFWLGLSLTFSVIIILAFFSWHYIEKPALNFAKK